MLSLAEADEVINRLLARPEPLIVQLPRQSGRREGYAPIEIGLRPTSSRGCRAMQTGVPLQGRNGSRSRFMLLL